MPAKIKSQLVGMFLVIETGWLMIISAMYEYVDRSYKTIMYGGLLVSMFVLIFVYTKYPESPKFYYTNKRWAECR